MAHPSTQQLLAELRDFDKDRRRKAVYKLGMIGGEEALQALMFAVGDSNEDTIVRGRAAQMLGHMRDSRAVDPLINALWARGYQTPIHAAEALSKLGETRAIGALQNVVDRHENEGARKAAAQAIETLNLIAEQDDVETPTDDLEPAL